MGARKWKVLFTVRGRDGGLQRGESTIIGNDTSLIQDAVEEWRTQLYERNPLFDLEARVIALTLLEER